MYDPNYHPRDHFDDLEDWAKLRGITWKNGTLRNSSRRATTPQKIYQDWMANYRGPRPPLTAEQFEELILEITQEESKPDVEYFENPEAFVDHALENCPIKYDIAMRAWMGQGGVPKTYKQLEDTIMLQYYQYRNLREGVKWVDRHVQLALQARYDSCEEEARAKLQNMIPFDPSLEQDSRACLLWIFTDVLRVENPELCTDVFRHWLWQVKRYTLGKIVAEPIMVNIRGAQGCGKTQFIRMLTNCRGLFRGYFDVATLDAVLDGRESHRWARQLITFFDELVQTRSGEDRDIGRLVAGLKQLLTAETISWRELGKHTINNIPRTFSAISASNGPLVDVIRDETGMRRFFEIVSLREEKLTFEEHLEVYGNMDQEIGEHPEGAMDPLMIWKGVNENLPQGYIVGKVQDEVRQVQATYRKKDNLEWILETAGADLKRPVLDEQDPDLYKELEEIQLVKDIVAKVHSIPDMPYRLETSFQVEKGFRDWMRSFIPEMVKYLPGRENFISALASKGYPPITRKGRTYFVMWETYNDPDGGPTSDVQKPF